MRSCRFRHPLLSVLCALLLGLAAGACGAREPASPLIVARDGQSQITIIPDWLDLRDLTHDEAQIQVGSRLLNQYLIVLTEPRPADVTLERGATRDHDLFDWFQDVAITSSGLGLPDVAYKRNLDIVQQDRDGVTLRRWTLVRAWPVGTCRTVMWPC